MARDFSPITFFQRTPNALLGRYFQKKHGVLTEIDFDELVENSQTAETIFQAMSQLTEQKLKQIEAECQEIEAMTHQAGVTALIDEAMDFHKNAEFPEAINQHESFHGKVMWTFLEYPNYWAGATSNLYAENIRCPPWRAKRRRVVPGSREATRDTRRAEGAKGDPKGASERGVQSYGRPVCSRNELAMLWRNAG